MGEQGRRPAKTSRIRSGGLVIVLLAASSLWACSSKGDGGVVKPHVGDKPIKPIEAPATALGEVKLAGFTLAISRRGEVKPGVQAAVVAKAVASPPRKDWRKLSLYVWFEDAQGTKINPPERAAVVGDTLYVPALLPKELKTTPTSVHIRVRAGALDQQTKLDL